MSIPASDPLVPVDLTCGHQRRVDHGINRLVDVGVIDHLWCIHCSTDQPTATGGQPG